MIAPRATLGVLGGGQLGAMFAHAARRLGFRVAVWDPDPDAPAHGVADLSFPSPFDDVHTVSEFASSIATATYEWENVPAPSCEALEQLVPVRPQSRILRLIQNRLRQKTFFAQHGVPVAPFRAISSAEQLAAAGEIGFPCLCKTATTGYDGKGQWRLDSMDDVEKLQGLLRQNPRPQAEWILEQWMPFDREVSVLVVRGDDGDTRIYPVVENVHGGGILQTTRVPASVDPQTAAKAMSLSRWVVEALEGIGVFCVEIFVMHDGALCVNEVAPRPHNSGHYTLDACTVSQFEQQVRSVCGLPLGEVRLLSPAAMVNLIGDDVSRIHSVPGLKALLSKPGAVLHLYGKRMLRPRRKMGHVTFLAEKVETAWESACRLRDLLHK